MNDFDIQLTHLLKEALAEDIGDGDHSSLCCIAPDKKGKAVLKIKQAGILAGVEVSKKIFEIEEPSAILNTYKQDGEAMQPGEIAFEVEAHIQTILKCERLVLNCMQRMSAIATLTKQYADLLKGFHTKILDTRKTTPNFRLLEKEAVGIGGGLNHRFGLFDMILLKDNHIDYCGGIKPAIDKAWGYVQSNNLPLKIEIETRNMQEVEQVCTFGKGKVFRIMLDNFIPQQISTALEKINNQFETEASGGINLDNVIDHAKTRVDYVSIGGLIHQAQSLDMSLKAVIL